MTADRFEARVADWLEDGPEVAPSGLAEKAVDHAAAHPRSRLGLLGRRIRQRAPLLAVAAVVVALVGAGVGGLQRFRFSDTPVEPVAVSGSQSCTTRVNGAELHPDDTTIEIQNQIDVCQDTMSDPRVTGEQTRRLQGDLFEPDATERQGAANFYGTMEVRTGRGSWTGAFVATLHGQLSWMPGRLTWIALGSGEYDGLVYRATAVTAEDGTRTVTGTIEAIGRDAVVASTWCWVNTAIPGLDAEGPVPHRDAYRDCTITSNDDRLNGMASEHRAIDVAGGATTDTGELEVATVGGHWSGTFSGTGDWYVPGLVRGVANGSGGYDGLTMSFTIASEDGMHSVLVGSITRAP